MLIDNLRKRISNKWISNIETTPEELMRKGIMVIVSLILISSAILVSCSTDSSTGITPTSEQGWICDNDRGGGIRVYKAPYKNSPISAYLVTCIGCCRDATVSSMKKDDGIIFYWVNADGGTGWVTEDYFYPDWSGKPDWSNNWVLCGHSLLPNDRCTWQTVRANARTTGIKRSGTGAGGVYPEWNKGPAIDWAEHWILYTDYRSCSGWDHPLWVKREE